ncbi:MAG: alpha/beta hydrolase [Mucilaginibacter polytrichastri]|nr:alpha/beta hydrolase [Mucilaginibacter polytrichastri]
MKFLPVALCLSITVVLFSCSKSSTNNIEPIGETPAPVLEQKVIENVAYGEDERNIMDVYLPKGRTSSSPFVVLIHGGSWIEGDKSQITALQQQLVADGIASVNMNYRFASETFHIDGMMGDVARAIAFCKANAADWGVNVDKIGIGGVSSGGHMAMLYALKYDKGTQIDCILSAAGPTIFDTRDALDGAVRTNGIDLLNIMAGAVYSATQPISNRFVEASPIRYVNENIPTLFIHGTADVIVPYQQSVMMKAEMDKKGYTNKLVTFDGAGHDLGLNDQVTATTFVTEIRNWIKTYETK